MKKIIAIALVSAGMLTTPALAATPFDGTWKTDTATMKMSGPPENFVLANGMYACKSCVPAYSVKADGTDQPVKGQTYFDTVAVKIVDDRTLEFTDKRAGKVVYSATRQVSADGKTMTEKFTDSTATNKDPITGSETMTRLAAGPKGAHATSGTWKDQPVSDFSQNALLFTYSSNGSTLNFSSPTGQAYSAKINGPAVPFTGDAGSDMVKVRVHGNALTESYTLKGKRSFTFTGVVSKDGKSMLTKGKDIVHRTEFTSTAIKQ